MSLWSRLLAALDAPRFCPDCGEAIVVEDAGAFDPQTGRAKHEWFWTCPDPNIRVEVYPSGGYEVTRYAGERHVWGMGRPRWATQGAQK